MMNGHTSINEHRPTSDTLRQVNGQLTNLFLSQTSNTSTNVSLNASTTHQHPTVHRKRMFQVRRTFLLIVTFDVIFMVLLWIIYNQIKNIAIDQAFKNDVLHYSIKTSLFDVVGLSGLRFIFLMIPYAILRWSHWIFVAFTTLGSTGFIIAKTCVFTISQSDKGFTDYSTLIVSFIVAWIEIWFFDYRVIPHERRMLAAIHRTEREPLLSSEPSRSTSPMQTSTNYQSINMSNEHRQFYSPVPSMDGSDNEEKPSESPRQFRSNSNVSTSMLATPASGFEDDGRTNDYEHQADEVVEKIWRIFQDKEGWGQEAKSSDGVDVVVSKTYPVWGKVFRLSSVIPRARDDVVELLFDRQEDMSKWSPTVNDCRILEFINRDLYISYQMTNEQAQGMVAKRDFVNLTARRYIDDVGILAAQACLYPQMPPKNNCVRGENGPTAYILEKIDDSTSRFTWLLNVDLKGWLPQYLINSSLANVQITLVDSLRKYINKLDMTSSFSSSTGDNST